MKTLENKSFLIGVCIYFQLKIKKSWKVCVFKLLYLSPVPPTPPTPYNPPTPIVPPTPEVPTEPTPEVPEQPAQPQTPALPNTGTESSIAAVLADAMAGLLGLGLARKKKED